MLLIKNISQLYTMDADFRAVNDAAILIDEQKIFWLGPANKLPQVSIERTLDAKNCMVMPGLIDCHTHLLFSGTRADEFAQRMQNKSYESIQKKGGGIYCTVDALAQKSEEEIFSKSMKKLDKILSQGVTTVEIKSGYGLSLESELKYLRIINRLQAAHKIDIHRTFLGAHVIPKEFKNDPGSYVSLICNEMLPAIAEEKLADDCDVFCESSAFDLRQSETILQKAYDLGLGLRAHVQQLGHSGGARLVQQLPIKSFSHLDFVSEKDLAMLAQKNMVVECLPIAALFLRSKSLPPVEKFLQNQTKLAIATDFNPGSAMCDDLVLASRLAVTYLGFDIKNAALGITNYAAQSLGRKNIGTLEKGQCADLIICELNDLNEFFYDWTRHPVKKVIKSGKIIS